MSLPRSIAAYPIRRRRRRGFSLIDAILALSATFMLVFYGPSLMLSASSATNGAQQTTIAYNAARQQIENIRSYRGAPPENRREAPLIGSMPQLAQLDNGTGTVTIAPHNSTPVKKVTVKIRWRPGGRGALREIRVTTLVAHGGVTP